MFLLTSLKQNIVYLLIFRMGGCIWSEAGGLDVNYGKGTKTTSVLFVT